ncbi:MAG: hypothetical protein DRQ06_00130 [Candidatus Hydrothermota bacterium]|nr:MAG: hypothetical protein DRQ06_00130 [Candidatus Hydrothermae bacterium]
MRKKIVVILLLPILFLNSIFLSAISALSVNKDINLSFKNETGLTDKLDSHNQLLKNETAQNINFIEQQCFKRNWTHLKENAKYSDKLKNFTISFSTEPQNGLEGFWMDFKPGGGSTRDGGLFEGGESWSVTKQVTKDDFDDTDNKIPEWTSSGGLYSKVRSDEDLWDDTSAKGAWCTAAGEEGVVFFPEDSRGWAVCEKSFNINDFVDISQPGFSFVGLDDYVVDTALYCDYRIFSNDFDDERDYLYYNIYLKDGTKEWPFGFQYRSPAGDAPKNYGWCTDFWDPDYSDCINPKENHDNYRNQSIIINFDSSGGVFYYLWDWLNDRVIGNGIDSFTLKFEIFIRLYGEGFDPEYIKFWVDNAALKIWYWTDSPPFEPSNPSPLDGATDVSVSTDLKWSGGDPDDYVLPKDTTQYKVFFGTSPSPPLVDIIGPYTPENHGPFTWSPPQDLEYGKKYYWKIVAVDSFGVEKSSEEWCFTTASNKAPNTPSKPTGPSSGKLNTDYTFTSSTTDPEGDDIYYLFDWDDGSDSGWLGTYTSGEECSATHRWQQTNTYEIRVKSKDVNGRESDWSPVLSVSISNNPPNTPNIPSGPMSGYHGEEYCYSTSATDTEGQQVKYCFDWGDGTTSCTDWLESGSTGSECHKWEKPGTYCVKAKTEDKAGGVSSWSDCLLVEMTNRAPGIPYAPYPENGSNWVETNDILRWSCDDPDSDSLKYDIYFGNGTLELVKENHNGNSYDPFGNRDMEISTTYIWQVKAKDSFGGESLSPVWCFTTREYHKPVLSKYDGWSTGCDKKKGTQSEYFTFRVHYYDKDKDCPSKAKLVIDKSKEFDMNRMGNDPCHNANYEVKLKGSEIGGGEHEYYFSFGDGRYAVSLPSNGQYWYIDINHAPDIPQISGPSSGKPDTEYCFTAYSHDPDGDDIQYWFKWGDESETGWVPEEWISSDEPVTKCHSWGSWQTFEIRVKARDVYGDESGWSTFKITINKAKNHQMHWLPDLINRFLVKFPIVKRLFNHQHSFKNIFFKILNETK